MTKEAETVEQRYVMELERHFGSDRRRVEHGLKVWRFAEQIMAGERIDAALTRRIITITALLHDAGIKIAEAKHGSSAGTYQEIEGPAIVRPIMDRHSEAEEVIERVAYIVGGHHTPAKNDGLDFQVIWEADLLVNIAEDGLTDDAKRLREIIAKNFRTATGRRIAEELYLK